ncbi:MAG: choice-of-anchor L domain-containing protein [Bacteroidia bacterium]
MKRLLRLFLQLITAGYIWGITPMLAQNVTVSTGSPFSQYVTQLEGSGIDIVPGTIVINCDTTNNTGNPAMGAFLGNGSAMGLPGGTILTSGALSNAIPPAGGSTSNNFPGDPTINALPQWGPPFSPTNDACAITFDFVPSCDTIKFRYVFASNEYPTFVGLFDDVFAAFIQGPGFPAFTNIALIPGVNAPVSINNVNAGTNAAFFIANTGGTGYNSRTVILTGKAAVIPCQTYTMKFVIADEGDFSLDSGVFLEEVTCGEDPPSVIARNFNNPFSPEAVEECVNGYFTFFNPGDNSVPLTINYTILGTATSGADYVPLPASITIPAGQDSINLPVTIIADGITEGPETLILALNVLSCLSDTAVMTILDPFRADAGPNQGTCSGDPVILGGAADPLVTYAWQSNIGLQGPLNSANPTATLITTFTQTYNYVLHATDENGCIDSDTVQITYVPLPQADFAMPTQVCVNDVVTITFTKPPIPGATYVWDFGTNVASVTGAGFGPYVVSWNTPGPKTVSVFVIDNTCTSNTVTKTITVNPIPTATFGALSPVCAGQPTLVNYTGSAASGANFLWDTDGGLPNPLTGPGPHQITWSTPGQKEIKLVVIDKGCPSPEFKQFVTVFPVPSATFTTADSVCEGEQVQIVYTGAAASLASFAWNFDGGQVVSGSGIGPYTVFWPTPGTKQVCLQVEENGCISNLFCENVKVLATPVASIAPVANQCLAGNSFTFTYNGSSASSINWIFGPDANPAVSSSFNPGPVSYINPGIKTVTAVVTKGGCVSDTAKITFEVIPEPSADFTASSNGICSDECITFNYSGIPQGPNQTYLWNFGAGAIPPTSTQPNPPCVSYFSGGVKTVTLTVTYKGCVVSSSQTVTINSRPIVSAGADLAFCEGDGGAQIQASVTGGTAPYFYSWTCSDPPNCGLSSNAVEDPFANPHVAQATDTVVYYLIVNDVNGCESNVDSVQVTVKAKPRMHAGPDIFLCEEGLGDFLQGSVASTNHAPQPISYHWQPSLGLSDPNVPNPYARPAVTTIYTL